MLNKQKLSIAPRKGFEERGSGQEDKRECTLQALSDWTKNMFGLFATHNLFIVLGSVRTFYTIVAEAIHHITDRKFRLLTGLTIHLKEYCTYRYVKNANWRLNIHGPTMKEEKNRLLPIMIENLKQQHIEQFIFSEWPSKFNRRSSLKIFDLIAKAVTEM